MEPKGSLLHLQVPATCPCPDPARSSPYPTSQFMKIHLKIIVPSIPGSSKWSLFLRFPHQKPCIHLSSPPVRGACQAHLILFDLAIRIILDEDYISLSSLLYSFLHSPLTSSLIGQNILFNTPFSNTLSLSSSLNMSD